MIRVLHLINDMSAGGAQTLVEAIAAHSSPSVEHHLAVLLGRDVLSPRMDSVFTSVTYFDAPLSPRALPRSVRRLTALLTRLRPHVLHSHLVQSDLVSVMTPVRETIRVSTCHNSRDPGRSTLVARAANSLVRRASHRFSAVVACDPSAVSYAREAYPGTPVRVITNGIGRSPMRSQGEHRNLLSLASLRPQKAHDVLLRAFAEFSRHHPDWTLTLAGRGITLSNLDFARLVLDSGAPVDRVRALGPVLDVLDEIGRADALVFSSNFEGLPMAGLEALSAGLPVISTAVGGCGALVLHPDLLVEAGSPDALCGALTRFASLAEDERSDLSQRSRRLAAERFDIASTVAAYESVYLEALQ